LRSIITITKNSIDNKNIEQNVTGIFNIKSKPQASDEYKVSTSSVELRRRREETG